MSIKQLIVSNEHQIISYSSVSRQQLFSLQQYSVRQNTYVLHCCRLTFSDVRDVRMEITIEIQIEVEVEVEKKEVLGLHCYVYN